MYNYDYYDREPAWWEKRRQEEDEYEKELDRRRSNPYDRTEEERIDGWYICHGNNEF